MSNNDSSLNKKYKYSFIRKMSDEDLRLSLLDMKKMFFMSRFHSALGQDEKNKRFPFMARKFIARIKTEINYRSLISSGKLVEPEGIVFKKVKYRD